MHTVEERAVVEVGTVVAHTMTGCNVDDISATWMRTHVAELGMVILHGRAYEGQDFDRSVTVLGMVLRSGIDEGHAEHLSELVRHS